MKNLSLFLLLFFTGFSSALAQSCAICDTYLPYIYDKVSINRSVDFRIAFETWFLSDSFEKEVKGNNIGLEITVPLIGEVIPVTFGGSYESKDAWEKWNKNRSSTKWDFSSVSKEKIYTQVATPESREIWLQCIKATCSNLQFSVDAKSGENGAIYTFAYNPKLFEAAPIYQSFESIGGLSVTSANKKFKGKLMKKSGEAIVFPWKSREETEGGIILNTNKGASVLIMVSKKAQAQQVSLTYISTKLEDITKKENLVKIGEIKAEREAPGMNGVECSSGCEACSWDGKYCARVTKIEFNAGPEQVLGNYRYQGIDRVGYSPGWSVISTDQKTEGENVYYKVVNHGPPSLWLMQADIFKAKTSFKKVTLSSPITSNAFKFSIPKDALFPSIALVLKNNRIINFELSGKLPKEIRLTEKIEEENEIQYSFSLN